jgi:hypothetical protein
MTFTRHVHRRKYERVGSKPPSHELQHFSDQQSPPEQIVIQPAIKHTLLQGELICY